MSRPLTPAELRAAAVEVITKIDQARSKFSANSLKIAKKVQSNGKSSLHSHQLDIGQVERKGQGYKFGRLSSMSYEIINDDWGMGISIGVNDIADDLLHLYEERMALFAKRLEQFPDDGVFNLLQAGTTEVGIDGQAFFSNTHYADPNNITASNTFDNLYGLALDADNFNTCYAAMMVFPDGKGRPLGLTPTHLVVPPQLRKAARAIIDAATLTTGGENLDKGAVELVVEPLLTSEPTAWYLISTEGGAPFIIQEREALQTYVKNLPTDDNVFFDDVIHILAKGRGEFGLGLPQRAIRSKP